LEEQDTWKQAKGIARFKDTETKEAKLQVRFSKWSPWGDYRVVYTDYDNIAVVYS